MAHSIDVLDRVRPPHTSVARLLLIRGSHRGTATHHEHPAVGLPHMGAHAGAHLFETRPQRGRGSQPRPLGEAARSIPHMGSPPAADRFHKRRHLRRDLFSISAAGGRTNSAWIALFLTPSMVTQISLRRCPPQLEPRRTASPATPLQHIFFAPPVPRLSSLLELESSAYPGAYCSSSAARTRDRTASSRTSSAMTSRSCRSTTTRIRRQEPRYTHRQFLLRLASSRPTMRVLSGMGRATMLYLQYRPLPARGTRIRRRATGRTTSISGPGAQVERADSAHNQHPASGTQCRVGIRHRIPG